MAARGSGPVGQGFPDEVLEDMAGGLLDHGGLGCLRFRRLTQGLIHLALHLRGQRLARGYRAQRLFPFSHIAWPFSSRGRYCRPFSMST
jgi:hypothetical protein